jgi:ABC-2 type transport system permease protein
MHPAITIATKDLRQKVRDRSAIILSVIAPFTLAALFSLMLPSEQSFHTTWAYVDLDGGAIAGALRDGPLAAVEAAGVADIVAVASSEEARTKVDAGDVGAAIVVPAGFSAAVARGAPATIELIVTPEAVLSGQVARSVVAAFTSDITAVQLAVSTALAATGGTRDAALIERLAAEARALPEPIVLADQSTAGRQASSPTFYAASMAVLFVFFAAQFGVVSLLAEKRGGTLARMLAAPISPRTVLIGKLMVSLVLATVSMTVIAVGTTLLLGASWGDPIAVAALIVATAAAASGIALLIVGFARTEDQAGGLVAIVALTLAVLGGSFFPMTQAPEALARLSYLTPQAWFLRGVNDLAGGGGLTTVLVPVAVLVGIAVVTGGIGLLRARRVVSG